MLGLTGQQKALGRFESNGEVMACSVVCSSWAPCTHVGQQKKVTLTCK